MGPVVLLYSGQGSQFLSMGAELFAREPTFRSSLLACDEVIAQRLGLSIAEVLYAGGHGDRAFDYLPHTHPALFAVQYALTQLVESWDTRATMAVGYSIGELIAWTAAGGTSLDGGLDLALRQASLVEHESAKAGMMAILGPSSLLSDIRRRHPACFPAAFNFARHFVVTATDDVLESLQAELWQQDLATQRLPVRRGFHSELIEHLQEPFRRLTRELPVAGSAWPIVSSTTSTRAVFDESHAWRVAREPVQFQRTIERLEREQGPCFYLDLGPSGTLATFLKHLLRPDSRSQVAWILGRSGRDAERARRARSLLSQWQACPRGNDQSNTSVTELSSKVERGHHEH